MAGDEEARPRRRRRPSAHRSETANMGVMRPEREQTVDFYGDPIQVAQSADGTLYVALRPVTDFLELDFSSQRHRVMRDEVMAVRITPVLMTAADGRQREQICLPLDLLPGWLFGVSPRQARPEIMDKLKRYRADCFRVLWQAFAGEASSVVAAPCAGWLVHPSPTRIRVPSPASPVLVDKGSRLFFGLTRPVHWLHLGSYAIAIVSDGIMHAIGAYHFHSNTTQSRRIGYIRDL